MVPRIDHEFIANALERAALAPEHRKTLLDAAGIEPPISAEMIDVFIYGLAPRRFAAAAYLHFKESGCETITQILHGTATFRVEPWARRRRRRPAARARIQYFGLMGSFLAASPGPKPPVAPSLVDRRIARADRCAGAMPGFTLRRAVPGTGQQAIAGPPSLAMNRLLDPPPCGL